MARGSCGPSGTAAFRGSRGSRRGCCRRPCLAGRLSPSSALLCRIAAGGRARVGRGIQRIARWLLAGSGEVGSFGFIQLALRHDARQRQRRARNRFSGFPRTGAKSQCKPRRLFSGARVCNVSKYSPKEGGPGSHGPVRYDHLAAREGRPVSLPNSVDRRRRRGRLVRRRNRAIRGGKRACARPTTGRSGNWRCTGFWYGSAVTFACGSLSQYALPGRPPSRPEVCCTVQQTP